MENELLVESGHYENGTDTMGKESGVGSRTMNLYYVLPWSGYGPYVSIRVTGFRSTEPSTEVSKQY